MSSKKFEDLDVWQKAKEFSVLLYKVTNEPSFKKDFGMIDQLRRASVSIVSNIAEGYERNGNKELVQFLSFAKGSAGEIRAQLHIARELEYINENQFKELYEKISALSKMLAGFIAYIKGSDYKGAKFVNEPDASFES